MCHLKFFPNLKYSIILKHDYIIEISDINLQKLLFIDFKCFDS